MNVYGTQYQLKHDQYKTALPVDLLWCSKYSNLSYHYSPVSLEHAFNPIGGSDIRSLCYRLDCMEGVEEVRG
jgi:hypothetical protein